MVIDSKLLAVSGFLFESYLKFHEWSFELPHSQRVKLTLTVDAEMHLKNLAIL